MHTITPSSSESPLFNVCCLRLLLIYHSRSDSHQASRLTAPPTSTSMLNPTPANFDAAGPIGELDTVPASAPSASGHHSMLSAGNPSTAQPTAHEFVQEIDQLSQQVIHNLF